MPHNNPFVGGVHISSYGGGTAAPETSSGAAVTPLAITPSAGPSYATPMFVLLAIALFILIIARVAGIRLLTTVSARAGA